MPPASSSTAAGTPDTVYRIGRRRAAIYVVLCVGWFFFSWGLFEFGVSSRSVPLGLLGMILSTAFIFASTMVLVFPTQLTLTGEGFDLRHWTAHEHAAWRDLDPLRVEGSGVSGMVVYSYTSGLLPPGASLLHRLNHAVGGIDGSLPGGLPIKAPELCAEMNTRRDHAVGTAR
jgi:hypothetical protein